MGTAGLVARPMASILEATGRTAQSIRNRSNPHESNRLRVRFPRPVARDRPLFPYSWEEAIGISLLIQADGGRLGGDICHVQNAQRAREVSCAYRETASAGF